MRFAAWKASSFDRPTWKVAKVNRLSRGEPVKASPNMGAEGVRLAPRRSAGARSPTGSGDLGAALAEAALSVGTILADGSRGVQQRTKMKICNTGPNSALSAVEIC